MNKTKRNIISMIEMIDDEKTLLKIYSIIMHYFVQKK